MNCEILKQVEEATQKGACCNGACENCPFVNNDSAFPRKKVGGLRAEPPVEVSYEEMLDEILSFR